MPPLAEVGGLDSWVLPAMAAVGAVTALLLRAWRD